MEFRPSQRYKLERYVRYPTSTGIVHFLQYLPLFELKALPSLWLKKYLSIQKNVPVCFWRVARIKIVNAVNAKNNGYRYLKTSC